MATQNRDRAFWGLVGFEDGFEFRFWGFLVNFFCFSRSRTENSRVFPSILVPVLYLKIPGQDFCQNSPSRATLT